MRKVTEIDKCSYCGSLTVRCVSVVGSDSQVYGFCNLVCKKKYFEERRDVENQEKSVNKEAKVLPELRTFVGRKTPEGVDIVRGDLSVQRGPVTEED